MNAKGPKYVKERAIANTDPAVLAEYGDGEWPLKWAWEKGELADNGNYLENDEIAKRHGICGTAVPFVMHTHTHKHTPVMPAAGHASKVLLLLSCIFSPSPGLKDVLTTPSSASITSRPRTRCLSLCPNNQTLRSSFFPRNARYLSMYRRRLEAGRTGDGPLVRPIATGLSSRRCSRGTCWRSSWA